MGLNSLFTGLSGIQAHQTRTNVVADNIANINTTGFKARRASFQTLLSQTFKEATGPEGGRSGTNPVQAGTGVRLKSIESSFNQGSIQNTGRQTDLAIEGDGFFILSDNVNRFYTRDGGFTFDSLGRFINPSNGLVVLGNNADAHGNFGATTGLQEVQVDLNQSRPGVATTQISLSGNVELGKVSTLNMSTEYTTSSYVVTTPFPPTGPAWSTNTLDSEQQVEVLINTPEGMITGIINIPDAKYDSASKFVDALNASIAGNERLSGRVIAQVDPSTEATPPDGLSLGEFSSASIRLQTTFGGTNVQLSLSDVVSNPNGVINLGFNEPVEGTGALAGRTVTAAPPSGDLAAGSSRIVTGTDDLNELSQIGSHLSKGDILRFSGIRSDGSTFNGTFTYDPTAPIPQQTVQNFLDVVAAEFGDNVSGHIDPTGKIKLLDSNQNTVTGSTLSITLDDAETGNRSGIIGSDGLRQHKISTKVFDSQGRAHILNVTLAESPVSNKWTYNIKVDNQTPQKGASGTALFDQDGTIRSFVPTEGEGTLLEFAPDGDVLPLKVSFTGITQATRGIQGLTQFAAPSTADVVDQNGRASGRLDTIFIRTDGVIEGRFTNGETLNLARINIANFDNEGGLRRMGGNLYTETENTGSPLIEIATETTETQILSESLELSNVDLAQEFTDLIISQRGFQANARVVTTTDQILVETVNLKQ